MRRLIQVELTRFLTRRAIVALMLLGVVMTGALAFKTAWDTRPPSDQEMATAQAQANLAADDPTTAATMSECLADPVAVLGPNSTKTDCRERLLPSAESLLKRAPLSLPQALDDEGGRLAAFLIGLMVIAGATFAGADWGSGSMTNQVIFEPRRLRLWTAKAIAASLSAAAWMLVLVSGFWLTLFLVSEARDIAIADPELSLIGWHVVRAVVLAAGAAVGAYALTMFFRHTVAALALLFMYAAGSELLVSLLPVQGIARWTIGNNVFGFLKPDFTYLDPSGKCAAYQECNPVNELDILPAGLFLLALLVVAVVVSIISFRRRDV